MVARLRAAGVRTFCVCPGGRNAPLVEALEPLPADGLEVLSFFDERSAGFFALGRARRDAGPVAVVTTSGTAAAELLPAMVEAHYSAVPARRGDRRPAARVPRFRARRRRSSRWTCSASTRPCRIDLERPVRAVRPAATGRARRTSTSASPNRCWPDGRRTTGRRGDVAGEVHERSWRASDARGPTTLGAAGPAPSCARGSAEAEVGRGAGIPA